MRIDSIEFKNIFAYGEKLQRIEYSNDGKLILLKGKSGSGKTAILSLPCLLIYGKFEKIPKFAIANRINKNGFLKGTIYKNNHTYVIERYFMPTKVKVFKDGQDIENFGSRDAQTFIDNEIADMPYTAFSNLISISMKRFKGFLSMSPWDRKTIIDRVFSLEVINIAYENIKKDLRELGTMINTSNSTLYSLNISYKNANSELIKLQKKAGMSDSQVKIEQNNVKITELNAGLTDLIKKYKKVNDKNSELTEKIILLKKEEMKNDLNIKSINGKIDLFNKEKCPTCGVSFSSSNFAEIKKQLKSLLQIKNGLKDKLTKALQKLSENKDKIDDVSRNLSDNISKIKSAINQISSENTLLSKSIEYSSEYESIKNIIEKTLNQIKEIKDSIDENNLKIIDLQDLLGVYSIEGVKQQVINNYLPTLNKEIFDNLLILNFPYQLEFDTKFDPHLKDLGTDVPVDTLSDGEMTRVDLVILCSLLKILKFKYPSINILSLDEIVSTLDQENALDMIEFLKKIALKLKLNIFVVSHVDLESAMYDECLEIIKNNGFSDINRS